MDDLVKEDHVKKKVYGDSGFKPDQMVQQGIDEFVRLAITADDRILYDIDKQIDKIRLWIMTREIDDKTGDAVVSGIIKLDGVLESRDKIKARIEKNVATGAVRGNRKLSMAEQRQLNDM
jgi:cell division FtsZ-interacting protein ZapD